MLGARSPGGCPAGGPAGGPASQATEEEAPGPRLTAVGGQPRSAHRLRCALAAWWRSGLCWLQASRARSKALNGYTVRRLGRGRCMRATIRHRGGDRSDRAGGRSSRYRQPVTCPPHPLGLTNHKEQLVVQKARDATTRRTPDSGFVGSPHPLPSSKPSSVASRTGPSIAFRPLPNRPRLDRQLQLSQASSGAALARRWFR